MLNEINTDPFFYAIMEKTDVQFLIFMKGLKILNSFAQENVYTQLRFKSTILNFGFYNRKPEQYLWNFILF